MRTHAHRLSADQLKQAREWAADCHWRDSEPEDFADPSLWSDEQIARGIERHYDGGISQFLTDCAPADCVAEQERAATAADHQARELAYHA